MKVWKRIKAITFVGVAVAAAVIFGLVAYKLTSVAGIAGVVIVVVAILINGFVAKVEDDMLDDFQKNPASFAKKTKTEN